MRPVIGIVPLYDEEKDSYWMLPGYMKALEECLSIPVMLPLTEDKTELLYFIRTCDGLLLPGGQDVDPASYGEERLPPVGPSIRQKTGWRAFCWMPPSGWTNRFWASAAGCSF